MNYVTITGNLGDDPKDFYTPDGVAISTFQMAFRSGKDKTSWIKINCYKKLAELSNRHLHKGARVGISGILDQEKWIDDHGNQKTGYRIIANQVEFIKTDGRGFDNTQVDGHKDMDDIPDFP